MAALVALLDANVLIPAAPRDTLLRAADAGLFRVTWSDRILLEVESNLVEQHLASPEAAATLCRQMRRYFPEALVSGFDNIIDSMTNHEGDRHVLAAAVHARADLIVTENDKDFPASSRADFGIEVASIDAFLVRLMTLSPDLMLTILREQAADLTDPPLSVYDVLANLRRSAPRFVEHVMAVLA